MTRTLTISIALNVGLLGGVLFLTIQKHKPVPEVATSAAAAPDSSTPSNPQPPRTKKAEQVQAFHWSQLNSGNDYKTYLANLRAIGCPEATISDIVRGDARRAFAFKRAQLGLDGSGTGPWSQSRETALVAGLLESRSDACPNAPNIAPKAGYLPNAGASGNTASTSTIGSARTANPPGSGGIHPENVQQGLVPAVEPVYPVAFRQVNLADLGFGASEQAAIKQVQEQFVKDIGGLNQNPNDPAYLARWQKAQINADDELRAALGSQGYMAFVQQQYYDWFKPQVQAAADSGSSVTINPALFSVQQ